MWEVVFGVGFALLLPIWFGLDGALYSMPVSNVLTFILCAVVIRYNYRALSQPRTTEPHGKRSRRQAVPGSSF